MLGTSWPLDQEFYQFGGKWDASKPEENVSQVGRLPIPIAFTRERLHVLLSIDTDRTDLTDMPLIKKAVTIRRPGHECSGAAAFSTQLSVTARTSGAGIRLSAPMSSAASAGRLRWRADS
jgi:hypothetical protein